MATNRWELDALLERLHGMFGRRLQDRRMDILHLFEEYASTHWAGPGHVTVNQFARAIDMLGCKLSRQEMTALCNVYCDTDLKNEFNYISFCAKVDPTLASQYNSSGETCTKFLRDTQGPEDTTSPRLPTNPYFDQFGNVKPLAQTTGCFSPRSIRSPRKDKAMLRNGFQPVGANIVSKGTTSFQSAVPALSALFETGTVVKPVLVGGGAPSAFALDQEQAESTEGDLARIKALIFRRRSRTKEFFTGWDPDRKGRCTREQFSRGIANIIHPNTFYDTEMPIDIVALTKLFVDTSSGVIEPRVVIYTDFCKSMDGVFNKHDLENRPTTSVPKPGHNIVDVGGFHPRPVHDMEALQHLMRRIAYLVNVHGLELSTCFNDCHRSDTDQRIGRINADSFIRHFPLAKSTPTHPAFLDKKDMELLIQRFTDDNGWVRLNAFQAEIEELQRKKPVPSSKHQSIGPASYNTVSALIGKMGL